MFLLLEHVNLNPFEVFVSHLMLIKQATHKGQNYENHINKKVSTFNV
jgi:hypothetical protein